MSRRASMQPEVLGDLLALDAVEVRCRACGRKAQCETGPLLSRLAPLDWVTPLDEAARHLRCACGSKAAEIDTRRRPTQRHLQLVPTPGDG